MSKKHDLSTIARDVVMAALDGIVDRAGNSDGTPGPVQLVADRWKSMSKDERDEVTKYVSKGVEAALAALPIVAAAASSRVRRTVKRRSTSAKDAAVAETDAKKSKKDKKGKKDKKRKKKKNKKDKKNK